MKPAFFLLSVVLFVSASIVASLEIDDSNVENATDIEKRMLDVPWKWNYEQSIKGDCTFEPMYVESFETQVSTTGFTPAYGIKYPVFNGKGTIVANAGAFWDTPAKWGLEGYDAIVEDGTFGFGVDDDDEEGLIIEFKKPISSFSTYIAALADRPITFSFYTASGKLIQQLQIMYDAEKYQGALQYAGFCGPTTISKVIITAFDTKASSIGGYQVIDKVGISSKPNLSSSPTYVETDYTRCYDKNVKGERCVPGTKAKFQTCKKIKGSIYEWSEPETCPKGMSCIDGQGKAGCVKKESF